MCQILFTKNLLKIAVLNSLWNVCSSINQHKEYSLKYHIEKPFKASCGTKGIKNA